MEDVLLRSLASSVQSPVDPSTRLRCSDDDQYLENSISDSTSDTAIKTDADSDNSVSDPTTKSNADSYNSTSDPEIKSKPECMFAELKENAVILRELGGGPLINSPSLHHLNPGRMDNRSRSRDGETEDDVTYNHRETEIRKRPRCNGADEGMDHQNVCPPHPGEVAGMCVRCGRNIEDESGVPLDYIHKGMKFSEAEMARIRNKDFRNLVRNKKLYLILDLDHTLLNSTRLCGITAEERYLHGQQEALPDTLKGSLYMVDRMQMMTKLRPFVHTLLKEANDLFEMCIYTMGERPYALEMAKLLDPKGVYFNSRIIARSDCTQRYQKGLDVVLGQESGVIILDDTEAVWGKHKENLILMERYNFFASSCKQFVLSNHKSLSELKSDESETEGALATVLQILQRVHSLFFDEERKDKLEDRDVRQVLKSVQKEVLKGCNLVFTHVSPTNSRAEQHPIWKMAERLGATCSVELNPSVTHVVSADAGTDESRWAVQEKKYLVHPRWIEASNYMWKKQPEENFPVGQS